MHRASIGQSSGLAGERAGRRTKAARKPYVDHDRKFPSYVFGRGRQQRSLPRRKQNAQAETGHKCTASGRKVVGPD